MKSWTTYLILIILICQETTQNTNKKNWQSPNAWAKSKALYNLQNGGSTEEYVNNNKIPHHQDEYIPEDINLIFYLKLVKFIFNPEKMKINALTGNYYRKLNLDVTPEQLEQLKKLTNSVDLDSIVTDILHKSSHSFPSEVAKQLVVIVNEYAQCIWDFACWICLSKRIMLILQVLIACGIIRLIQRYIKIHWFVSILFFVAFLLYEYLDTECHRQKDIKYMMDLKTRGGKNPCDGLNPTVTNSFWNYFFPSYKESECKEYLNEHFEIDITKCTSGDLFNEFMKVIFYNQLKFFIDNMVDVLFSTYKTHGIILTGLISLVICVSIYGYLGVTIKSFFKYILSPSAWTRSDRSYNPQQEQPSIINPPQHMAIDQNALNAILLKLASEPGRPRSRKKFGSKTVWERQNSRAQLTEKVSGVEILATEMVSKQNVPTNAESLKNEKLDNVNDEEFTEEFEKISITNDTIEEEIYNINQKN